MIDASRRLGKEISRLIDGGKYFLVHASRQTGKTTLIINTAVEINKKSDYYALYTSLEVIQGINDPKDGIPAIIKKIKADLSNMDLPKAEEFARNADYDDFTNALNTELKRYCKLLDRPLVIFFDEADCLCEGTLISFLRQLRDGYNSRGISPFIHSVALVGLLNLRDYKALVRPDSESTGVASPFNIITESMKLRAFEKEEVEELCLQHSKETGQVFDKDAIDLIWEKTAGQPWLVNAVAREIVEHIFENDYSKKILAENVVSAADILIKRRDVHFDALIERLKEPRIKRIVEAMISGEDLSVSRGSEDYLYAKDLGLIRDNENKTEPANPMYAEMIVRALSWNTQTQIRENYEEKYDLLKYMKNGRVNVNYLLEDFQDFWRKNSEIFKERFSFQIYDYVEAAPHLVLQAFLQRVYNGGGFISREMAIGSKRADLCISHGGFDYPIEIKIYYDASTVETGKEQLSKYVERCKCEEGWLVIFDRSVNKEWDEKIYSRTEIFNGKKINIFGC